MSSKYQVSLGEVQETLLIPLYGRAVETGKKRGILRDPKAVEMVEAIDYDFARFDGAPSLMGSAVRTSIFDVWVHSFLTEHPAGTVVEMGAGLNTRFERLDNGQVRWLDLDLPDAAELRRRFFTDTDRRQLLVGSILDPGWVDVVKELPGAYFFAVEAVLPYLAEQDVQQTLGLIAEHFPGSRVAFDTCGSWIIANQHRHDVIKRVQARMQWACDDPRQIERWDAGLGLLESRTLAQLPRRLRRQAPVRYRLMLPVLSRILRKRFAKYKVNLFEIAPRSAS